MNTLEDRKEALRQWLYEETPWAHGATVCDFVPMMVDKAAEIFGSPPDARVIEGWACEIVELEDGCILVNAKGRAWSDNGNESGWQIYGAPIKRFTDRASAAAFLAERGAKP